MRRANMFLWTLALAFGMTRGVGASPIVLLTNAAEFQAAINDGRITGFTPPGSAADLAALNAAYPGQAAEFRTTTVSTDANGLISAAGSAADLNTEIIGAWSYSYPTDPNLTGLPVEFQLFFPQVDAFPSSGINAMSFAVVDNTNDVKLWQWNNAALLAGVPQTFTFNLSAGAGAGGSTSFFQDVGFDLANATVLQISHRGVLGGGVGGFPPPPGGGTALWIGTRRLTVTPEPSTLALLALGMGAVGCAVWRRRRQG